MEKTDGHEESSKTVLTIARSSKSKGASELNDKLVYERVIFKCKAGSERPTQSHGHRHLQHIKKIVQPKLVRNQWLHKVYSDFCHKNNNLL